MLDSMLPSSLIRSLSGSSSEVPAAFKVGAALFLFLEALFGIFLPALLSPSASRQWHLSLLNCFAGGVFLSAGLVHMVPDCQEAQRELWPQELSGGAGASPLYLMLIGLGYLLVFFVERVLLDVHGENVGHVHCEHSNVFSHSHFYLSRTSSQEDLSVSARPDALPTKHVDTHPHPHPHNHTHSHSHGHSHPHTCVTLIPALTEPLLPAAGMGALPPLGAVSDSTAAWGLPQPWHAGAPGRRQHKASSCEAAAAAAEGEGGAAAALQPGACPEQCGGRLAPEFMPLHGALLLGAMVVHTFLECMALGSVTDMQSFGSLFIAIASHKAISALALSSRYFKEGATLKQVACHLVPFAFVAPLSIAVGAYVSSMYPLLSLVLTCLATGTFLYIGCGELTMEEFEGDVRCGRTDISPRAALLIKFGLVLVGAVLIALVALLPES